MDEKRDDGQVVRVMTRQERLEYDDITIEDCSYEESTGSGTGSGQAGSSRPETFNEAYGITAIAARISARISGAMAEAVAQGCIPLAWGRE